MSLLHRCWATLALSIALLMPCPLQAETILSGQGTAAIEGNNIAQAEKIAIQDALHKAVLQEAIRSTPQSSTYAVTKKLPLLLNSRGMQDVTQYKVTSRTQQANFLFLTVEFKLNDAFLRDWLTAQRLYVPSAVRPKVLVAVSSNVPGEGLHEWWYLKGKKGYSAFESLLADDLDLWGENVFKEAPNIGMLASGAEPYLLADRFGAALLLRGALKFTALGAGLYQCTLNLTLNDVRTHATLGNWTVTRKGELPATDLYAAMIGKISEDIRARIDARIQSIIPSLATRQVCIENISDHATYQKIVDTLSGLNGIETVEISRIAGHTICHTVRFKGRLEDVMQALQNKKAADVDIQIKDDMAQIVINR